MTQSSVPCQSAESIFLLGFHIQTVTHFKPPSTHLHPLLSPLLQHGFLLHSFTARLTDFTKSLRVQVLLTMVPYFRRPLDIVQTNPPLSPTPVAAFCKAFPITTSDYFELLFVYSFCFLCHLMGATQGAEGGKEPATADFGVVGAVWSEAAMEACSPLRSVQQCLLVRMVF